MSSAVNPGFGWYRVFDASAPHPFHCGLDPKSESVVALTGQPFALAAVVPSGLPARYSASARFSLTLRAIAGRAMLPLVIARRISSAERS
jgi:hypothetical protein